MFRYGNLGSRSDTDCSLSRSAVISGSRAFAQAPTSRATSESCGKIIFSDFKIWSMALCTLPPNSRCSLVASGRLKKFLKYHFHAHSKKLLSEDADTVRSLYFSLTSLVILFISGKNPFPFIFFFYENLFRKILYNSGGLSLFSGCEGNSAESFSARDGNIELPLYPVRIAL